MRDGRLGRRDEVKGPAGLWAMTVLAGPIRGGVGVWGRDAGPDA